MAEDPILKTYNRTKNLEEEAKIDEKILRTVKLGEEKDEEHLASIFVGIVSISFGDLAPELKQNYLLHATCERALKEHPALKDLLVECLREKNFTKFRDLEILRPKHDLKGVERVRQDYGELFTRLSIDVKTLNKWELSDIILNGGQLYTTDDSVVTDRIGEDLWTRGNPNNIPDDIKEIQNRLGTIRTFAQDTHENLLIYENYQYLFELVFRKDTSQLPTVENDREYAAFFALHRCYIRDVAMVAPSSASSFKASTFCAYFVHPSLCYPLFQDKAAVYTESESWGFPVFIRVSGSDSTLKYSPRSDWAVLSRSSRLPLAISEIISQKNESDENRMLLQAIALARAGAYFMKEKSEKSFFLVAVYLSGDLKARRYIVKAENSDPQAKVNILRRTFHLIDASRVSVFLLEMLNLCSELKTLAEDFDSLKMDKLLRLNEAAKSMTSLTTAKSRARTTGPRRATSTITEVSEPSHFDDPKVHDVLERYGHTFGAPDAFHPKVALILDKKDGELAGYLKFVEDDSQELEILQYLAKINSPKNHTIRYIHSWAVPDGHMVLLPRAGRWITNLENISKHLWGAVRQLFEGVAFLHENNIAHLDLKPSNLLMPASYGKLTIIDFGVSVRLDKQTDEVEGRVGTKEYMAPEVGSRSYSPIKADLYSCGMVVSKLCQLAEPSTERDFLLSIACQLTDIDPNDRPSMSEALADLETYSSMSFNKSIPI